MKPWFDGQLVAIGRCPTSIRNAPRIHCHGRAPRDSSRTRRSPGVVHDTLARPARPARPRPIRAPDLTVFGDATVMDRAGRVRARRRQGRHRRGRRVGQGGHRYQGFQRVRHDPAVQPLAALTGDDLGFMFIDTKALFEASTCPAQSSASPLSARSRPRSRLGRRAHPRRGRRTGIDAVMPQGEDAPGPTRTSANGVAAWRRQRPSPCSPATTSVARPRLDRALRSEPALADAFAQIDQAAGMLGGLEALLSWMGDTGVVIADGGDARRGRHRQRSRPIRPRPSSAHHHPQLRGSSAAPRPASP